MATRLRGGPARLLLLAAVTACRGSGAGLPDAQLLHSLVGSCSEAEGDVQVRRVGYFYWEPVVIGTTFRAGDWLRTGALSTARVEFLAGSGLDVAENTTVIVDAGLLTSGKEHPLVSVETGATQFSVGPAQGPIGLKNPDGSVMEVDTAQREETVVFRVEREGDRAALAVSSGSADVKMEGRKPRSLKHREVVTMSRAVADEVAERLLAAPEPLRPLPDARVAMADLPVRLTWSAVDDASIYVFQVASDARMRRLVRSGRISMPNVEITVPVPGPFWWRVASRDALGRTGVWSAPSRLVVEGGKDQLVGPADGAVLSVRKSGGAIAFSWRPEPRAKSYRLVLGKNVDLRGPVKVARTGERELEMASLKPGTYFWGVFAEEGGKGSVGQPLFTRAYKLTLTPAKNEAAPKIEAPSTIEWK